VTVARWNDAAITGTVAGRLGDTHIAHTGLQTVNWETLEGDGQAVDAAEGVLLRLDNDALRRDRIHFWLGRR